MWHSKGISKYPAMLIAYTSKQSCLHPRETRIFKATCSRWPTLKCVINTNRRLLSVLSITFSIFPNSRLIFENMVQNMKNGCFRNRGHSFSYLRQFFSYFKQKFHTLRTNFPYHQERELLIIFDKTIIWKKIHMIKRFASLLWKKWASAPFLGLSRGLQESGKSELPLMATLVHEFFSAVESAFWVGEANCRFFA